MEEHLLIASPPPETMEDVEKLIRASDLADRSSALVSHARTLALFARGPHMPESQVLAAAAESLENAATALSASEVRVRPQAAGALLRACIKMGVAADEAGLEQLAEDSRDTADEAAEVVRLASEFKEIMSFQPRRGWLRRFGSSSASRAPPPRPNSGEHQVDSIYFALSGGINLLPYIGRAGLLKDTSVYSDDYLWWVSVLFSSVWGALGVGLHAQEEGGHGCKAGGGLRQALPSCSDTRAHHSGVLLLLLAVPIFLYDAHSSVRPFCYCQLSTMACALMQGPRPPLMRDNEDNRGLMRALGKS